MLEFSVDLSLKLREIFNKICHVFYCLWLHFQLQGEKPGIGNCADESR